MKVAIVGAGIMGLASAWALARDGHAVTIYERSEVPNPLGSSVDEHRLIRHAYGGERGYTRMIDPALAAWDLLWADLGTRHYAPTGTLVLDRGDRWTADTAATLAAENIAFRRLSAAELTAAYPALEPAELRGGLVVDTGGTLFARRIVADLARHLRARGVAIERRDVRDVDAERGRATLAGGTVVEADLIVVAAGPWVTRLVAGLRGRVTPSRQVVVYLAPPADQAALWLAHPMVLDLDPSSGFYLVPPRRTLDGAVTGLKLGDHSFTLAGDPDRDRVARPDEAQDLVARVGRRLRAFSRFAVREAKTCFYDVEPDQKFIVERLGARGYVLSGFSGHGFKFAAVLGLELAKTVAGRRTPDDLARWAAGSC